MSSQKKNSRLEGKDLITIGIYTVIYVVIVMLVAMLGFIPIFIPLMAVLVLMIGQVVFSNVMFTVTGAAATISTVIVCRWGMGALGASTDLNSRMAWLQAGLDGPMYDATVENLTHSWQMLGLISLVSLVAAWLVLQIAFDKKKA